MENNIYDVMFGNNTFLMFTIVKLIEIFQIYFKHLGPKQIAKMQFPEHQRRG